MFPQYCQSKLLSLLQIDKHVWDKLCSSLQDYVDVESPEQVVTDEAEIQENNRLRAASVSLDTNF